MAATVKIKDDKYGNAIGLLLRRGGSFQTLHEQMLVVNAEQKKILEEAGLIDTTNDTTEKAGLGSGQEKKSTPGRPGRKGLPHHRRSPGQSH